MEIDDSFGHPMSPTNAFIDKLLIELDSDAETVVDLDFNEPTDDVDEHMQDIQHITDTLFTDDTPDCPVQSHNDSDCGEEIVANDDDDLLMGSQLLAKKYRKNGVDMTDKTQIQMENKSDKTDKDIHKRCRRQVQRESDIRIELSVELEIERQQRIKFQRLYEHHLNSSLDKEVDDYKHIVTLKREILRLRRELRTMRRSPNTEDSSEDEEDEEEDVDSIDTNESMDGLPVGGDNEFNCTTCSEHMKSEVSLILHLINHCIDEKEFKLETKVFKLDEFTESVLDSIRKTITYCCPRCVQSFNCLEIYYHIYKYHSKEQPLICNDCKTYFTHIDLWTEHMQLFHSGIIQKVTYVDIGSVVRQAVKTLVPLIQPLQPRNPSNSLQSNRTISRPPNTGYRTAPKLPAPKPPAPKQNGTHDRYGVRIRPPKRRRGRPRRTDPPKANTDSSMSDESDSNVDSPEVILLSDEDQPQPPPPIPPKVLAPTKSTIMPMNWVPKVTAPNPTIYNCDFPDCSFTTNNKEKLQFHINAHTNSKFKCPYCPYVGNILNDIIRHIQKSKKHDKMPVYECRECSYGSNDLSSFKEHLYKRHFDTDDESDEVDEYISDMFSNQHSKPKPTVDPV